MAKNTESSALAEYAPGAVDPAQVKQAYAAILDGVPIPQQADPETMSRAIVERIMQAETFEQVFQPSELEPWREAYLGVPVKVRGFHLNASGFEQGSSVYAVVDLVPLAGESQGEIVTVTCGGRNVLTQLVKALEKGWLDRPVKLVERGTASGFRTLWLVSAELE